MSRTGLRKQAGRWRRAAQAEADVACAGVVLEQGELGSASLRERMALQSPLQQGWGVAFGGRQVQHAGSQYGLVPPAAAIARVMWSPALLGAQAQCLEMKKELVLGGLWMQRGWYLKKYGR